MLAKHLDRLLEALNPIAPQVAGGANSIVVMACNCGQAELLHDFVCDAPAKGSNISKLLMFAADVETFLELAKKLGVTAFCDETLFAAMPTNACCVEMPPSRK